MTGSELRGLREARGLRQSKLAERVNMRRQRIWEYEHGHRPIPKTTALLFTLLLQPDAQAQPAPPATPS